MKVGEGCPFYWDLVCDLSVQVKSKFPTRKTVEKEIEKMRTLPNKFRQRVATMSQRRRRAQAQEELKPGDVSPALRRRMREDDIVEMFENAGRSLYKKVVEQLKDVLRDSFNEAIPELEADLKAEGGRRWQKAAAEFYRPWINDLVETIVTQGMNEAAGTLEDVASSYAAEQSAPDEEEEEGDSLIEVPLEETEEVEEVDVEPAEEEGEEEEGVELELEELLSAADASPRTITRPRPRRRRVQADDRWMPEIREYRRPIKDPSVEETSSPPFVEEVLNAVLDGLEDEYVGQVESREIGVNELSGDPWGLLSAEKWNVDVLYDDRTGTFDMMAAVYGPQEDYDEWWSYTGEETTSEMGRVAAQWLNNALSKVHRNYQ